MRVCLIGNLVGYAYTIAKFLRARGVDADLLLSRHETGIEAPQWGDRDLVEIPPWIKPWDRVPAIELLAPPDGVRRYGPHMILTSLNLLRMLHEYDAILSFATLSMYSSFSGKPYIACANGSDLRELAQENSLKGRLMRRAYRKADRVVLWNIDHVGIAERTGLSQARFVPFALDSSQFAPGHSGFEAEVRRASGDATVFFHPSHLDWSYKGTDRSSTKGNDRFIRAFGRFVREGNKGFLVILDRGVDRELSKQLITDLKISAHVKVLPELDRVDLIQWYRAADVVADQFDIGSFGTTALEAMACGKPVLIHIDAVSAHEAYGEVPPVLNARTEDEIYEQMLFVRDRGIREEIGAAARRFVLHHHDWRKVTDTLAHDLREICGTA
jgi:glycosyltransferase involved in cell wall biosynthesis